MSMKEAQEQIIANMKKWQKVENAGIASTGKIMEKADNPIVRLVMVVIQRDSQMHYRVQQLIQESLEGKAIALQPEELASIWDMIENHQKLERETIELATKSIEAISKSKGMLVQHYLLQYLQKDEQKHEEILINLEKLKSGMYPYA